MSVLSVNNLSKNYGNIQALQNVSFEVPKGTIFGILGPNGSGKTTLLGIAMNVLKATSGSFSWNGVEGSNNEQRKQIGTLLETPNFYHYLSGQKNLEITAEIKGRNAADIARVLEIVNLTKRKDSKFNTYSLGMKQRLAIANALLGNPDTLVFDEPTNGLDPAGIAEIRELMIKLRNDGKTIIMASHILDEVERVCSHVAIIQKGVLKTVGTVQEVLNTNNSATEVDTIEIEMAATNMEALRNTVKTMTGFKSATETNSALTVTCSGTINAADVNSYCMQQGVVLSHLVVKKKSLESRFLEITGKVSDR
jgi:lantibiotic transport system ATP-binding protein